MPNIGMAIIGWVEESCTTERMVETCWNPIPYKSWDVYHRFQLVIRIS